MTIDLSKIAPPLIIEVLDFETLYQAILSDFMQLMPEWSANKESDPVVKLLEVAAYREILIRNRINDAAKACMLAYAIGADLDNLATLLGVARLTDPSFESDAALRKRAQMSIEATTVAGSARSYIFHALSVSTRIKDVAVDSPSPGIVRVTLLTSDNNGTPDAPLIASVTDYLSAETRRPLTDSIMVVSPTLINYAINAVINLYPGPSSAPVMAAANIALQGYLESTNKLGADVTRSGIFAALHQPGVRSVELISPLTDVVIDQREAANCTSITIAEGSRDV